MSASSDDRQYWFYVGRGQGDEISAPVRLKIEVDRTRHMFEMTLAETRDLRDKLSAKIAVMEEEIAEVTEEKPEVVCRRCAGCGKIADSDDGEPWKYWQDLPPGADLAVRAGIVKPITCPACNGTGMTAEH